MDFRVVVSLESRDGLFLARIVEIDRDQQIETRSNRAEASFVVDRYRLGRKEVLRAMQERCLEDFMAEMDRRAESSETAEEVKP